MWWSAILDFLNAVTLQFANWPSDRCGGRFRYSRPAFFLLNSVTLQFVNRFSLGGGGGSAPIRWPILTGDSAPIRWPTPAGELKREIKN